MFANVLSSRVSQMFRFLLVFTPKDSFPSALIYAVIILLPHTDMRGHSIFPVLDNDDNPSYH